MSVIVVKFGCIDYSLIGLIVFFGSLILTKTLTKGGGNKKRFATQS